MTRTEVAEGSQRGATELRDELDRVRDEVSLSMVRLEQELFARVDVREWVMARPKTTLALFFGAGLALGLMTGED